VVKYLRRGKKRCTATSRKGVRICEINSPGDTTVSEEGEEACVPGTGANLPLQPVEKSMVRQAAPLLLMEVYTGADIHLQPMEDPTPEQVDV